MRLRTAPIWTLLAAIAAMLGGCKPEAAAERQHTGGTSAASKQESGDSKSDDANPMTQDEEAANDLFVQDTVDAAADKPDDDEDEDDDDKDDKDDKDDDVDKDEDLDESVKDDGRTRRLEQMANMMMDRLDRDDSGDLSKEEFLKGPRKFGKYWKKHGKDKDKNKDKDKDKDDNKDDDGDDVAPGFENKIKERFTKAFEEFAGEDALLSVEELIKLLKDQLPNVGKFREKHHKGKHKDRVRQTWDEILAEYDDDADKLLNQEEFEAIEKDRRERSRKWRQRDKRFGQRE